MTTLYLFDMDGTLAESGQPISAVMESTLQHLSRQPNTKLGIVGGGRYEKIQSQLNGLAIPIICSELGCVIHEDGIEVQRKDIRIHPLYQQMNRLVKYALHFLSTVEYTLTGHLIDLRNGLIYISLIGLAATQEERAYFLQHDATHCYRHRLLQELKRLANKEGFDTLVQIVEGGQVGISIYPSEWDKVQVLDRYSSQYKHIVYFGDKYEPNGNDYQILTDGRVKGIRVNCPDDTLQGIVSLIQKS